MNKPRLNIPPIVFWIITSVLLFFCAIIILTWTGVMTPLVGFSIITSFIFVLITAVIVSVYMDERKMKKRHG